MAEGRVSRGERTRARLVEVAVRRFGDYGFRETSLSAIAREVALTPAAVYAHFSDKEELFTVALDHDVTTWLDAALRPPDAADATSGPVWLGLMQRLHARLPGHPLARRVLAGQEPEMLPRVFDLPAAGRIRSLLAGSLREGQQAGRVRRDIDPEVVAEGIATLIESTLLASVQTAAAATFADPARRAGVLGLLAAALAPLPERSEAVTLSAGGWLDRPAGAAEAGQGEPGDVR